VERDARALSLVHLRSFKYPFSGASPLLFPAILTPQGRLAKDSIPNRVIFILNPSRIVSKAAAIGAFLTLAAFAGPDGVVASLDGALPKDEYASEIAAPDWVVVQSDNICGLKKARQLSNPGQVDFQSLYDSTAEAKKIKKEGISESSPEGTQLKAAAYERIRKASVQVMNDRSLCSVWKKISSRSGKAISDVTENVRGQL
jgi:hypothetical protein